MHHYNIGKNKLTAAQQKTCEEIAKRNDSEFQYIGNIEGFNYTYLFETENVGDTITGPIVEAVRRELVRAGISDVVGRTE